MKIKIISIIIIILLITTYVQAIAPGKNKTKELTNSNTIFSEKSYSHNICGEFFTITTCTYCKYAHRALKNLYNRYSHPFYYISFVINKNEHASQRYGELGIFFTPTIAWDGDYLRDEGAASIIEAMDQYNESIISCGNRSVNDIDLSIDIDWSGAVNNNPKDGEENVSINNYLIWTNSEMKIDITIDNNEASQYNGHLHVYVTEINSTFWNDQYGDPYTFAFLDYAFNEGITISAGGTWQDSITWDGIDYNDGHGNSFENITQDNIMVIAAIFDENNNYVDDCIGFPAGTNNDPKTYDIYFGDSNPPPKASTNQSNLIFNPGKLEYNTTYFWKIVVWDSKGIPIYSPIWNFTTIKNDPPIIPDIIGPNNGKPGVNLTYCVNLSDPDDDDLYVLWTWSDGTGSDWLGPFESGTEVCSSHLWNDTGKYIIYATIKDEHGATVMSSKQITISKNKILRYPLIIRIFQQFPILEKILHFFKIKYQLFKTT